MEHRRNVIFIIQDNDKEEVDKETGNRVLLYSAERTELDLSSDPDKPQVRWQERGEREKRMKEKARESAREQ